MNVAAPERHTKRQVFFDGGYWTKNGTTQKTEIKSFTLRVERSLETINGTI